MNQRSFRLISNPSREKALPTLRTLIQGPCTEDKLNIIKDLLTTVPELPSVFFELETLVNNGLSTNSEATQLVNKIWETLQQKVKEVSEQ